MDRKRKLAFAVALLEECDVAFTYICKGDAETAFDNVFSDEDWTILKDKITEQIEDYSVFTGLDIDEILGRVL